MPAPPPTAISAARRTTRVASPGRRQTSSSRSSAQFSFVTSPALRGEVAAKRVKGALHEVNAWLGPLTKADAVASAFLNEGRRPRPPLPSPGKKVEREPTVPQSTACFATDTLDSP